MTEYEEFILKLTDKARQQPLSEIEKGILGSEGRIGELQRALELIEQHYKSKKMHMIPATIEQVLKEKK